MVAAQKLPGYADLPALAARFESRPPEELVAWAHQTYGDRLVLASSFSYEDVLLIDVAAKVAPVLRVIFLDTGRLHEETYDVVDRIRAKYGIAVEAYFPQANDVEQLVRIKGTASFRNSVDDRKECCGIRKVEPLGRALATADAWITGLRRQQSATRTNVAPLEIDAANGGIVKLNPLHHFSEDDVKREVKARGVPYNALHDRGFPSIGCAPCTRAIAPGEDVRAGRWWWESPDQKECGLHAR
jgi:phosphoadenosine phosphosulfate reductase